MPSIKPCKRGHFERWPSGGCAECHRLRMQKKRASGDETFILKERARKKKWASSERGQEMRRAGKREYNKRRTLRERSAFKALRELGIDV